MKRSNNVLRFLYLLFILVFIATAFNVVIVSIFKVHIRSNTNYGDYVENASVVKEVRKNIARIQTVLTAKSKAEA